MVRISEQARTRHPAGRLHPATTTSHLGSWQGGAKKPGEGGEGSTRTTPDDTRNMRTHTVSRTCRYGDLRTQHAHTHTHTHETHRGATRQTAGPGHFKTGSRHWWPWPDLRDEQREAPRTTQSATQTHVPRAKTDRAARQGAPHAAKRILGHPSFGSDDSSVNGGLSSHSAQERNGMTLAFLV